MFNVLNGIYNANGAYGNMQYGQPIWHILKSDEVYDYNSDLNRAYPAQTGVRGRYPFVGFKILLQDTYQNPSVAPAQRIYYLDQVLGKGFANNGLIVREADNSRMYNGLWLITKPVPIIHLGHQVANMVNGIKTLAQLGINSLDVVDITISGRSLLGPTEILSQIVLPNKYNDCLVRTNNSFLPGEVIRINQEFVMLKTRYNLTKLQGDPNDEFITLATFLTNAFR